MATRPWQYPASPAELVRAVVRALVEDHLQTGHLLRGTTRRIPADITLLVGFFAELFQKFVQALTENVASKPLILLHGVRKLGSDVFQFHVQPDIGVLEIIFLLPDTRKHALASI